jgi:hypothetical protein
MPGKHLYQKKKKTIERRKKENKKIIESRHDQ